MSCNKLAQLQGRTFGELLLPLLWGRLFLKHSAKLKKGMKIRATKSNHLFHSIKMRFRGLPISIVLLSKPDWATEMGSTNDQRHILRQQRNGEPSLRGGGSIQKAKQLVLLRIHLQDLDNQSMLGAFHFSPYQVKH